MGFTGCVGSGDCPYGTECKESETCASEKCCEEVTCSGSDVPPQTELIDASNQTISVGTEVQIQCQNGMNWSVIKLIIQNLL